ncbi:hypothetical protein EJ07DRAFT_178023 [Lizonia empirigonia]|nr:hypothetical protein EJ07DRAFT_178023 [Lizonia empirigonia]
MSGASTGRLIVEGVVENLRIFRIYKQDKAREAKEKEEERKERKRQRERKHHSTSHRGEGERNAHRHRHRRHSNDGYGDSGSRDRDNHDQNPKHHSHALETAASHAQDLIPSALHTAKSRVGPDGTPFGSLPTRGKDVGFLAHVKNTYGHIKAEQAAGHRSKGFAEKYVDAVLRKRSEAKPAGGKDKSQLIRNNGNFQPETGYWQREKRQKHRYRSNRSRRDKKEEDATDRAFETHIGKLRLNSEDWPVYEETAHSHKVEVREHAQAVEEEEWRQEKASRAATEGPRTATPFIAPHPKAKLPSNFQDELAAKLREASLSRPEQNAAAEIGPCKGRGVLKSQPSSESWRSNVTFHEEDSRIPNKTFRENLGNMLCADSTPQPQAASGGIT